MALITTSIQKQMELLDEKERLAAQAQLSHQEQQALQHYQQQLDSFRSPGMIGSSGYMGLGYPSGNYATAVQAQRSAVQQAYISNGNYYYGLGSGTGTLATASGTYTSAGANPWSQFQTPYLNKDDEWGAEQSQEAVAHGWMLTEGDNDYPDLEAVSWGTKKHMNEKEILQDVLTMCLTGECPIAHRILHLLSKNRSPYAEYEKTVLAMEADYSN